MALTIEHLAREITPSGTALFLGAGSSVGSGGPTGGELARALSMAVTGEPGDSDDCVYVGTVLELKHGRGQLVAAVRAELEGLVPTGGLLGLPAYDWATIYTTNFDRLIEKSYEASSRPLVAIRSNFDIGPTEQLDGTRLYKIHGCFTQDEVDGHQTRMLLTERDYETHAQFREVGFRQLQFDLVTKDVLVIGHSLSDAHLRRDVDEAARIQRETKAPGRVFVLSHDEDLDRALVLDSRGIQVAFGSLDDFLFALAAEHPPDAGPTTVHTADSAATLPPKLQPTVVDVGHALGLAPNATELFHGRAATYADIAAGLTFPRSREQVVYGILLDKESWFSTIVGVAGVGKTTMARRVAAQLAGAGILVWEHRSQYPLLAEDWIAVEKRLSGEGLRAVLVVDDAAMNQRQVNILAEGLCEQEEPSLQLLMAAALSQWKPRTKSPSLFAHGKTEKLSALTDGEEETSLPAAPRA